MGDTREQETVEQELGSRKNWRHHLLSHMPMQYVKRLLYSELMRNAIQRESLNGSISVQAQYTFINNKRYFVY